MMLSVKHETGIAMTYRVAVPLCSCRQPQANDRGAVAGLC
jgi:hypothetical protein